MTRHLRRGHTSSQRSAAPGADRPFRDEPLSGRAAALTALTTPAAAGLTLDAADSSAEQQADAAAQQISGAAPQRGQRSAAAAVDTSISAELQSAGSGQPLDPAVRAAAEAHNSRSFADVRVHTDRHADRINRGLGAQALTFGRDVFFRDDSYRPERAAGRSLIHHELAHVAQQRGRAPQLQAALAISADEMIRRTGVKGARVWSTSTYEKLIDALRAYEKLDKSDPAGQKADKRAELLAGLYKLCVAWLSSDARAFNDASGKTKAKRGDEAKRDAIFELLVDVQEEQRKYLFGIERAEQRDDGAAEETPVDEIAIPAAAPAAPAALGAVQQQAAALPDPELPGMVPAAVEEPAAAPPVAEPAAAEPAAAEPAENAVVVAAAPAAVEAPAQAAAAAPAEAPARQTPSSASREAQAALRQRAAARAKERSGFFGRIKGIGTALHYTFGTDFTVGSGPAALDPKRTLTPSIVHTLITLMDQADKTYDELVAGGEDPATALHLAYEGMPQQLQPKSTAPSARLVLNVRRQLLLEAIKPPVSSTYDTIKNGNTTVGETVGTLGTLNKTAGSLAQGAAAAEVGNTSVASTVASTSVSGSGALDATRAGSDVLANTLGLLENIRDWGRAIDAIWHAETPEDRSLQYRSFRRISLNLIGNLSAGMAAMQKIMNLFSATPLSKIIADLLSALDAIVNAVKTGLRAADEEELARDARTRGSGLAATLTAVSSRNETLQVRNSIKIVATLVKVAGDAMMLIPDPFGVAQAAGGVVALVGSIGNMLNEVAATVQDSYRAGKAQAMAQQAMAGGEEGEAQVLSDNLSWGVTAIILEAKREPADPQAVQFLAGYGVLRKDIGPTPLEELRLRILNELRELADPKTVTQKIVGLAGRIGSTLEEGLVGAGRGIGRAYQSVRN
jgi:hypothetical protein